MTKDQFTYAIISGQIGGDVVSDKFSKLHPNIVAKHITMAQITALGILYYQLAAQKLLSTLDQYSVPVSIQPELVGDKYVYDIPFGVVSLPENAQIRSIYPEGQMSAIMAPLKGASEHRAHTILDTHHFTSVGFYVVEGNRITWHDCEASCFPATMNIIKEFDSLDEDDQFMMPVGKGIDFISVLMQVGEQMLQRPTDNLHNAR